MLKDAERRAERHLKVQFGSGSKAYPGWLNFDCSPTLRAQKLLVIGAIARRTIKPLFDRDVLYGDTRKGLPVPEGSVDLLYCSHVLNNLSLEDFRRTLADCLRVLAPGGVFRGVLGDFELAAASYLEDKSPDACSRMLLRIGLGVVSRPHGLVGLLRTLWGSAPNLWAWDYRGLRSELEAAGFVDIRRAVFNDRPEFVAIEEIKRWDGYLGFECRKPAAVPGHSPICQYRTSVL